MTKMISYVMNAKNFNEIKLQLFGSTINRFRWTGPSNIVQNRRLEWFHCLTYYNQPLTEAVTYRWPALMKLGQDITPRLPILLNITY